MLARFHIEHFALIENLSVEFSPCLNVLTGETGAGKSILIDAIRFVLGERLDMERLSGSGGNCVVEAAFHVRDMKLRASAALETYFARDEEILILRREYSPDGRSRAWANNRLVNISTLKEIGSSLLDIHGQYDHQLLLDPASHIELLDRFGKTEPVREAYRTIFSQYQLLLKRREELRALESGREREMDLLKYQIEEIEKAELEDGEEEALRTERIRLVNAEKFYDCTARILGLLDEGETAASSLLGKASRDLNELARLDDSVGAIKGEYETAQLGLEEIIRFLREYQEGLSFEPERLTEIDLRLDQIELLKRKYGKSAAEILTFLSGAKEKQDRLENSGIYVKEIDEKLARLLPDLKNISADLTAKRRKAALSLQKIIETELADLGIPGAQFACPVEKTDFSAEGCDRIEFLVSLNAGQPRMPLRKIISAGEVSRVMLAMKKALMKVDPVPTLIFDEIDANIGGRLGSVTGQKLKEISVERQVLLITHLPQIASFADRHFKVEKIVREGRTFTEYRIVDGPARVQELAQMMSGKQETEISKKHAEEMLKRVPGFAGKK